MKQMTTEEQELLGELYKSDDRKVEILHSLARKGSMITLTFLLPFALEEREEIRKAALAAVHQITSRLRKQDLIGLDQYIRRLTPYSNRNQLAAWHELLPEDIRAFSINDEADLCFIGICSFHRNGYVREAAIELLLKQITGAEIPFLLIRLNDWQPKIRYLAFKACKLRFRPDYVKHFIESIFLLKHLSAYYNREKFTDFLEEIDAMFRHPDNRDVLRSGFHSKDLVVRRFCFDLAISLHDIDPDEVIAEALIQKDALIRLQTVRYLCKQDENDRLRRWLDRIQRDVFPSIRQLALQAYVDRFPEVSTDVLLAALLDGHKSIREMARFYLREKKIDFAAYYREKLVGTEEQVIPIAIVGVGEPGVKADDQWILPFLRHENERIQRAAVKALAMLNPEDHIEVFIRALQTNKRSASREAKQILVDRVELRHAGMLWEMLEKDVGIHVKKNILFLFSKMNKADSIPLLLRACVVQEKEIRDEAILYVEHWLYGYNRRFYLRLKDEQRENISYILEEVREFLPEDIAESVESLLAKK
ncbi:HEAT repeat domain-containing protein [Brevibacillus porteri]|uniref:HEAT repeat domain-containing protein n=1 Tax=Brevibacillus porteri TaxID=2126350 RepID=UPI00370B0BD0